MLMLCNIYCYVVTAFAYLFFLVFCKGKIYGKDFIKRNIKSGFILAANHSSYLDWLVLIGLFRIRFGIKMKFLAKEKIYRHPIWSPLAMASGIRVNDNGHKIYKSSFREILKSKYIGVFPEGTRSHNGKLLKPKSGIVKISKIKKLPIILTSLLGFYKTWPRSKKLPHPSKCAVIFCGEYKDIKYNKKRVEKTINKIMETIYQQEEIYGYLLK